MLATMFGSQPVTPLPVDRRPVVAVDLAALLGLLLGRRDRPRIDDQWYSRGCLTNSIDPWRMLTLTTE